MQCVVKILKDVTEGNSSQEIKNKAKNDSKTPFHHFLFHVIRV